MFNNNKTAITELQERETFLQREVVNLNLALQDMKVQIRDLREELNDFVEKTTDAFRNVKKDYEQVSRWDDHRREEIIELCDAAGLEIRRGTHLVPQDGTHLVPQDED